MVRSSDPKVILEDMKRVVGRVIGIVTFEVTSAIVVNTPVDTSWARSNWIPGIGEGGSSPVGSKLAVSASQSESGKSEVLGYRLGQGRLTIVNNVPYIGRLNNGYSKKAPSAFVQQSMGMGISSALAKLRGMKF